MRTIWILLLLASSTGCVVFGDLPLASDGKALMSVIIATNASAQTKAVAEELAGHLQRITGAPFTVQPGDGTSGIVLGTITEFPNKKLARDLVIRRTYDGKEAYAIRTERKRLLLIGATDLGTSHAAFRLLEHIGCRWLFPAKEWEVMPIIPNLSVKLNESDRPALWSRRIWYGYGLFDQKARDDYAAWSRHNRMAMSLSIYCGHAWQTIISDNQAAFDAHPEYLALTGGKRQGPQFCVSNPEVRKIAAQWAVGYLRRHPSADMVSLETADGDGHCECDGCKKLGSISDRVFGLANEVARVIATECPGKLVGLYAYNDHCEPPSFDLEPNVYVQSTAGFIRGQYSFDELIELWPKRCRNMGFYEYFSVWLWDFDRLPGGRGGNIPYIRQQIPRYIKHNATSLDCESGNNWGPHGRGYYVANKLMWNPKTNVDSLLADFYEKAFGSAASVMQRYYERFDPGNEPLMSEHLLALGFRDVEEATRLASAHPDVQARLDQIKQYLRYVHLRWLLDREKDKAKRKELTLTALTHVYRTRYTYMNHWEAMRQGWTTTAAREFDEPSWAFNAPGPKPWAVETPYSHEETESAFQEGLAHFQPQPVEEKSFSTNLVPLRAAGAPSAPTGQQFQGGEKYALYSVKGEPLECTIVTGTIAWYRDRPAASYKFLTPSGKIIAEAKLPLDGEKHRLTIPVPKPGLYFLDFNDSSAGWRIEAAADRACTLLLRRGHNMLHAGWMQPMYFHVPKGTREIQYFWEGGPHRVHGPDGAIAREVNTSGKFIFIPVPEGADGQCWHFTQIALGSLWFFNVPNYLAASPHALLVPSSK
jgi:hypothetical protein